MKVCYGAGFQGRVSVPTGIQRHKAGWQIRKTLIGGKKINIFVSHSVGDGKPTISLAAAVFLLGLSSGLTRAEREQLEEWMNGYKERADFRRDTEGGVPDTVLLFPESQMCAALMAEH